MLILILLALLCQLQGLIISTNAVSVSKSSKLPFLGILNELYTDEGEEVEVKYLTKSGGDYHIIQLKIPSLGIPLTVHLIRVENTSPQLRVNDGEEEIEIDVHNCFYFGQIVDFPGGTTALSDCGDHLGFTGHILLGNDHFVIEPIESSNTSDNSDGKGRTLLHKVFRAQNIMERENATHSDNEMKKAVAEMACEESEVIEDSNNSQESEAYEDSEEEDDESLGTPDDDIDDMNSFVLETFGKKSKSKKNTNKKKKKMSVSGAKVVEIAVFTDEKLFKVWQKRYPKETKPKMKLFVLNLVNNMNLLYRQPSLGVDVSFRLVYLEIMLTVPNGLKASEGDATKYLKSFCKYAGDKNANAAEWDHALLLTGFDLKDGGDSSIAGMAWFTTMCLKYWSCSVSEGTSFGSTFIVTHEIGHSLGMEHDGMGASKSCNENSFLMSPTTGSGKVSWSSCSTKNLKDFITKGSPEVNKEEPSAIPACITRASPLKGKRIPFATSKLPGEVYGVKAQCQYDCGTKCTPYTKKQNVCSMLWCLNGSSYREAHPALEGTSCDTGKHCRFGKCVQIPKSN